MSDRQYFVNGKPWVQDVAMASPSQATDTSVKSPPQSPRTALLRLLANDDADRVREALQQRHQGDPNQKVNANGQNLMHAAVSYGASSTLECLIGMRADVNESDASGMSPLHLASSDCEEHAVHMLLAARANIHAVDKDRVVRIGVPIYECGGRTPLHAAASCSLFAESQAVKIAELLLRARADLNVADCDGNTAWDVALRSGNKPKKQLAQFLCPGMDIPLDDVLSEAKREDYRARGERIMLCEARKELLEDSGSLSPLGDRDEVVPDMDEPATLVPACASAEVKDQRTRKRPFSVASSDDQTLRFGAPSSRLAVDSGPNKHRLLRGALLWHPSASDRKAAAEPFSKQLGASCTLYSSAALQAVLGIDGCSRSQAEALIPTEPPSEAYSWCYCGHQNGSFSGQLGDGAAMCALLEGAQWELHWKGCGRTPFSRPGPKTDGRKAISECVRELLMNETMAALGVAAARGLAVFKAANSPDASDPAGMLLRACPGPVGMVRFGTFDVANGPELDHRTSREGPSPGDGALVTGLLAALTEHLAVAESASAAHVLRTARDGSAELAARWTALGFVHGMLNTDNCHALGIGIDLAGGQFLGVFDDTDDADGPAALHGRYAFGQQPAAFYWGLQKLATALSSAAHALPAEEADKIVGAFPHVYHRLWLREMRAKLGLSDAPHSGDAAAEPKALESEDRLLVQNLLHTMAETFADFTTTFRCLLPPAPSDGAAMLARLKGAGAPTLPPESRAELLRKRATRVRPAKTRAMLEKLMETLDGDGESQILQSRIAQLMKKHDAAASLEELACAAGTVSAAEQQAADAEAWSAWLGKYAARCGAAGGADAARMERANPCFVPRAWAIDAAVSGSMKGDFTLAQRLVDLLPSVYDSHADFGEFGHAWGPSGSAEGIPQWSVARAGG